MIGVESAGPGSWREGLVSLSSDLLARLPTGHLTPERAWEMGPLYVSVQPGY